MSTNTKTAASNTVTRLPIPFFGDINNRRFMTAVLSGIVGGAGVSAAANLLRKYKEYKDQKDPDKSDEDTIVLTLPSKAAEDGYTSMRNAKPGETKLTVGGGTQRRESGRFGKSIADKKDPAVETKCASGNPGVNSVGTVVANTLGLAAGGLMSYEVVSRLFDAMNERRLKKKLEAAQQAYIGALQGESKRAEAVMRVLAPSEKRFGQREVKSAGVLDTISSVLPEPAVNTFRYPMAAYILALMAGTGATAYVTKKVMDREFPEEKLKKDVNRPTRIVFRTAGGVPSLLEGDPGEEKQASDSACAAIATLLPVYMDVVEGAPNRTLTAPYVKLAEDLGTDADGLMKLASTDFQGAYGTLLSRPDVMVRALLHPGFKFSDGKLGFANAIKAVSPDLYNKAIQASIDSRFANKAGDGWLTRFKNRVGRDGARAVSALGGNDLLVRHALGKNAEALGVKEAGEDTLLRGNYLLSAIMGDGDSAPEPEPQKPLDDKQLKAMLGEAKRSLNRRRRVSIEAGDPQAAAYLAKNRKRVKRLLSRMSAHGAI